MVNCDSTLSPRATRRRRRNASADPFKELSANQLRTLQNNAGIDPIPNISTINSTHSNTQIANDLAQRLGQNSRENDNENKRGYQLKIIFEDEITSSGMPQNYLRAKRHSCTSEAFYNSVNSWKNNRQHSTQNDIVKAPVKHTNTFKKFDNVVNGNTNTLNSIIEKSLKPSNKSTSILSIRSQGRRHSVF